MKFEEASIGRVVTSTEYRGQGHGKRIVQFALEKCHNLFGYGPIRVGAQLYLKQFYQEFGFSAIGDIYVENNIEHIDMIKSTIIS
jgi:ElaA protein